ncbi:MAG TPA: hypothetical protein VMN56_10855 [Casimicrobiaceae bacterium]|nr:hypothetical protein [Casimicrobiaceae bacterium]
MLVAVMAATGVALFFAMALWPRRRDPDVYQRLALVVATTMLLATAYSVTVAEEYAGGALILIAAVWICTWVMLAMAAHASPTRISLWLRVPFGMFLALATLLLLQEIWTTPLPNPLARIVAHWNLIVPIVAVLVAGLAALLLHDFVCSLATAGWLAAVLTTGVVDARAAQIAIPSLLMLAVLAAIAAAHDPREPRHGRRYAQAESEADGSPEEATRKPIPSFGRKKKKKEQNRRYLLEADSSLMRL